jgi:hypothetical protein
MHTHPNATATRARHRLCPWLAAAGGLAAARLGWWASCKPQAGEPWHPPASYRIVSHRVPYGTGAESSAGRLTGRASMMFTSSYPLVAARRAPFCSFPAPITSRPWRPGTQLPYWPRTVRALTPVAWLSRQALHWDHCAVVHIPCG